MDPYRAVAGQSGSVVVGLAVMWCFGVTMFDVVAMVLLALVLVFVGWLIGDYASRLRKTDAVPRDSWRRWGDVLAGLELAAPAGTVVILLLLQPHLFSGYSMMSLELATFAFALTLMLIVVLASSLVDWWYIRPRRDGLVRLPPCMTAGDDAWPRVTKSWLRHRLIAEAAFVLFFVVTGPVLTIEAYFLGDPGQYQWVSKLISPVLTLLGVAVGYSKTRLPIGIKAVNADPPFALGDTITWRTRRSDAWVRGLEKRVGLVKWRLSFNLDHKNPKKAGIAHQGNAMYVFDVALDNATTFRVAARRRSEYMTKYKAPMRALYADNAIIQRNADSVCFADGNCLAMHEHCARRLKTPMREGERTSGVAM